MTVDDAAERILKLINKCRTDLAYTAPEVQEQCWMSLKIQTIHIMAGIDKI